MRTIFSLLLMGVVGLTSAAALAAKLGRVAVDNAPIMDKAGPGAKVIANLPKGTVIATADNPTDGYYRMKSKTGVSGYISARAVAFGAASAPAARPSAAEGEAERTTRSSRRGKSSGGGFRMRLLGDLDMFNSTKSALAIANLAGLSNGIGMGLELGLGVSQNFFLSLRVETISKAIRATIDTAGMTDTVTNYSISVSGMPVMLGGQIQFMDDDSLSIGGGLFAGMGLGTKLTAEATADNGTAITSGNVTTFAKSAMTFLLKFDAVLKLGSSFGLFAEAGYRLLKASNATNTVQGTGHGLFRANNGAGSMLEVSPNLGGPVIGLGLQLKF